MARYPRERRFDWASFINGTAVAAIITAVAGFATKYAEPDNSPCRIATDFLIDDGKDAAIVDEATAIRLRELYVSMAERHRGKE